MKNLLVIVANASRARLYRVRQGVLERLESLDHPESRLKSAEIDTDRPGRAFDETGGAGPHRSGMEPPTDSHENELRAFAREVARRTSILARRGRFPEILVVAPPRFLGRVKMALDPAVGQRIVATVSHDYTQKDEAELVAFLQGMGVRVVLPAAV